VWVQPSVQFGMGIPPQVAAIETSGRYFAKSSRFLKICCPNSLVGTKTSAQMSLYLLIVKEAIQKQLFFLCQFWQAQPGQLCLLKVAELFAEFLWVQQFSTQKLLLELALKS
jgi:hypothetical protein